MVEPGLQIKSQKNKTVRQSLDEEFYKVILRFSLNDLKNSVPLAFEDEELTWDLIKKAMLRYNLSTKKQDIARLYLEYTKTTPTEELQRIYGNLILLDLMLHSNKKTWNSVKMLQENQIPADCELVHNITRKFLDEKIKLNVHSDVSNNIRWFALFVCKKKKNEAVLQRPIFIACPLNTSFIFYSPPRLSEDFLKIFIKSVGYDNLKVMKLTGKNISSLVLMLNKRKDADQVRARTSLALKNMSDVVAVKSSKGIDFCQDKIRSEHAREILGDESVQLENLVVNANSEWRGLRTLPEVEGQRFDVSMKISSKDVSASLKELIEKGVISQPYPGWLKEFMISGKNVLQIG